MSRSCKHTPVVSHTGSRSEKEDKRQYNRALRRGNRVRLDLGEEDFLRTRDVSDPWSMAKDGKCWVGDRADQHWYFKAMLK